MYKGNLLYNRKNAENYKENLIANDTCQHWEFPVRVKIL